MPTFPGIEVSDAPLADWTPKDVKTWLVAGGFPEVGMAAVRLRVDGKMLPFLDAEGWKELGMPSAIERARIQSMASDLASAVTSPAPVKTGTRSRGSLEVFSKLISKLDGMVWADHKKSWFQHLTNAGKEPEDYKAMFCTQLDSYNLMTLLLLSGVLPTAAGLCTDIGWDVHGWPLDKLKFSYLIFSVAYSGLLLAHFGLSHVIHLLVTGVSCANYEIFLKAFGIDLMTEAGVGYVVIVWSSVAWLLFTGAACLGPANWMIWTGAVLGILLVWHCQLYLIPVVLGQDDEGQRPPACSGFFSRGYVFLRLAMHSGLFGAALPLNASDTSEELLEQLAELSLEALEPRESESD